MTTPIGISSLLGDISHIGAFLILIISIHKKQSCEGWSGRMQILILISFITRLFKNIYEALSPYQIIMKVIWIVLSIGILFLIYGKYRKTYEKRCDTFWIESVILTSLALAFGLCGNNNFCSPEWVGWEFSHFCEAMSILPQIYFVWIKCAKDTVVTYYVTALVYYKAFYITHWIILYKSGYEMNYFLLGTGISQVVCYVLYYLMPNYKAKPTIEVGQGECTQPIRNIPTYLTQESLLETPLLKRSTSAIFVVSDNVSDTSSIHRSISNSGSEEGRF